MFGRKKNDRPPKDTTSVEFKRWMAAKLNGRGVRYTLERADGGDRIVGKDGFISVNNGILSIISGENTLFTAAVDALDAWEFMSLDGATLTGYDLSVNRERKILAYYKYYRK